jgi:hypothetical protein
MFSEPVARLFGPPYGIKVLRPTWRRDAAASGRGWRTRCATPQSGAQAPARSRGTAGIWLTSSEARALAAINRLDEANTVLARAKKHGTGCNPTSWTVSAGCAPSAGPASLATPPLPSLGAAQPRRPTPSGSLSTHWMLIRHGAGPGARFASVPIARSVLAVARLSQGQVDGAVEALAPVLDLPPSQRIHQIVTSVERARAALSAITDPGRDAIELAGAIEGGTAERLPQP